MISTFCLFAYTLLDFAEAAVGKGVDEDETEVVDLNGLTT